LAQYVARYYKPGPGSDYMWDELAAAAWIDPTLITKSETLYMDVNLDHGAEYGDTLTWSEKAKPKLPLRRVEIQVDVDRERLFRMFAELMRAPTPPAGASAH